MIRWLWNKMMKWGWDFNRGGDKSLRSLVDSMNSTVLESSISSMDNFRMSVADAVNGKVIQISKPILDSKGHNTGDREAELYVVAHDQTLTEVVGTILNLEDMK